MRRFKAFTLMELLVAVSIFSVIILCLYAVFAGGIRVWRRQEEGFRYTHTTRLALDKMAKELKNVINYSVPEEGDEPGNENLQFIGEGNRVSFMTILGADIAKVSYFFENNEGGDNVLKRVAVLQKEGFSEEAQKEEILVRYLSEVSFKYVSEGGESASPVTWKDSWVAGDGEQEATIPKGVMATLVFKEDEEEQGEAEIFKKAIFIPIGTLEEREES